MHIWCGEEIFTSSNATNINRRCENKHKKECLEKEDNRIDSKKEILINKNPL